jgi:DNA-binding GntR family transcriptional regulator
MVDDSTLTSPPVPAPEVETAKIDEVYQSLREKILDGVLEEGAPLSQVKLAEQYEVNRSLLREALRMLQREHLIEAQFNRRVRVAKLTTDELEGLYAERIALESLGVRLTVPRLSAADVKELRELADSMLEMSMPRQAGEWEEANREFHSRLVSGSGDHLKARTVQLMHLSRRYRQALGRSDSDLGALMQGGKDHEDIVSACEAADAARAGQLMALHLAHTALNSIAARDPAHDPFAVREALRMVGAPRD